ncbi:ArsR/SmtB family transcription factor [Corynebacterium mastitidis]|uniref:ArsR/SmtB family transcription factor n=1 Tax=Corynebacterium mastitidis TaxID=161890 RepID=UPI00254DB63A|nr:metalloregulator ArsR/SmtB family transcription factor [Corynebacterium mastitidis]MDK8450394.1 metalloregulator ArsR/SmtB family transcription factor [Corynebacterium mastitidis]
MPLSHDPLPPTTTRCCSLGTGPLDEEGSARYAGLFRVLAEPTRLRILSHLAAVSCGPVSVNDLSALVRLSQPTVSHHLKMMTEAGLLERRRAGRTVVHTVKPEAFAELRTVLRIGQKDPAPR